MKNTEETKFYNLPFEQDVVGYILERETDKNPLIIAREDLGSLGSKAFFGKDYRTTYQILTKLEKKGKPRGLVIVQEELRKLKIDPSFLIDLVKVTYGSEVTFREELRTIKELAYKRELENIAEMSDGKSLEETKQKLETFWKSVEISTRKPKVISLDELWKTEFEEVPYLIGKGLLPKLSLVLLIGHKKRGKTQLCLNMAQSLATGVPLFYSLRDKTGLFPITEKGVKTLFFFRENVLQTLKKWTLTQRKGLEEILDRPFTKEERQAVRLVDPREIPIVYLDTPSGREAFERIVKANSDVSVVVVDPLSRFIAKDLNKMENVTNTMNFLQELGLKYKVAFLLPHHCRKPSGDTQKKAPPEDPFFEAAGSSALINCYDSGIAIKRKSQRRSELILEVEFDFRNEQSPENITVKRDPETFLFEYLTSEQVAVEGASSVSALISIMKRLPEGARYTLIAEVASKALGVSKQRIAELLAKGIDEGRIWKAEGRTGGYFLEKPPKT